jgi:hypothetical protein
MRSRKKTRINDGAIRKKTKSGREGRRRKWCPLCALLHSRYDRLTSQGSEGIIVL